MGLFSFAKDVGDKIFHRNKDNDQAANQTQPQAQTQAAPSAQNTAPNVQVSAPAEPNPQEIANLLIKRIQQYAKVDALSVNYDGNTDTVTINGTAATQADREKAILAAGNVQHVEHVQDNMSVVQPAAESRMYTVKSGDTLSKIAKEMYGDANQYNKIFEANQPLLSDPNKIYPGQVLRIPE
ncbi:peptidoglycan-binding protein LysM [Moraxella atlantae]|uniref:Potassium binding protein Kbp n=1 Tax=Faucicola atlantae TaxID=34059 RepID=A0A1B8QCY0_9GAMM|nr:peptidoglycan-binding protein LysM [Moraxella atlantae]OBX79156.1 peptidoglycan-binding protein LysM [Moraxella atlantae]OPH35195.1 peptidoglycan-binding protein LysM [Moraxella atlantae]STY95094.1 LysM domain/BON superfamily protein [Moraxella atlantae]